MSLRAQAIAEGFKYIARRGSKIVAFASTKAEAAREGTPEKLPSVPAKYLRGFKGEARVRRVLEILRERRRGTFEPLSSDKGVSTRRSKWSVKFEQTYGERPDNITDVARLTGVPRAVLKQVYDRGLAAWSTGGHRPGASQHGWAMARVQSFVLGGPTTRTADKDLAKNPRSLTERLPLARKLGLVKTSAAAWSPLRRHYVLLDEKCRTLAQMSVQPPLNEIDYRHLLESEEFLVPCYLAWEVQTASVAARAQGTGVGVLLYSLVMYDCGSLYADRAYTSESAEKVWLRLFEQEAEYVWRKFDDVYEPQTVPRLDDCTLKDEGEHMDGAFSLTRHAREVLGPVFDDMIERGNACGLTAQDVRERSSSLFGRSF